VEEKIMGLQKFKLKTANTVISKDNASLESMGKEQIFELFSLDAGNGRKLAKKESTG
jgi:TATA-binding protein-associated factor